MPIEIAISKVVGVGRNYPSHAAEMGAELPREPLLFLKPATSLLASQAPIVRPAYERVDYEGELGVVIGKQAKSVTRDEALDCVLGYTCVNDVTIRDLQRSDKQWTRAKGFDGSCPIGPRIVGGLSPGSLELTTRVNGEVRQSANTSSMLFDVASLIVFISELITLERGDVISTGTPSGVGNLRVGDVVEVEIAGVGTLSNLVVAPNA